MRDRSYSFGALAPLSIYPLPAEDVADLLLGFIDFRMRLNVRVLDAMLRKEYRTHAIAAPPESGDEFLRAEVRVGDRVVVIGVSPAIREQMLIELMTPGNVSAALDALAVDLARTPGPNHEQHIVAPANEVGCGTRSCEPPKVTSA